VITRNAYGARCLNVPDVLFADIDFAVGTPAAFAVVANLFAFAALVAAGWFYGWQAGVAALVATWVVGFVVARVLARARWRSPEAALARSRVRIERFLATRPQWRLRVYRTPAGLRLLAMHRRFDPREPEVREFFAAIGVDPVYARMCTNQRCFRARVSAKPWRVGQDEHLKPRPGVWPVRPEHHARRRAWIEAYEARAAGYAACAYVESLGQGREDIDADRVRALHDDLSNATRRGMPLA
jgi:hypothetical protein